MQIDGVAALGSDPAFISLRKLEASFAGPLRRRSVVRVSGIVSDVAPSFCRVRGLSSFLALGDRVQFDGELSHFGEVLRLDKVGATVALYSPSQPLALGTRVFPIGRHTIAPSVDWKGRTLNAAGIPLDEGEQLGLGIQDRFVDAVPPAALARAKVGSALVTGVRAIDIFTPICKGQRIGIFAGSGVGKSTLLGMIAKSRGFDTVVIALVGERGREVRDFLEGPLAASRDRAVTIVSTGDESPMMRRLAAKTAMTVAEFFRDRGESVLLIIDSATRFAHASREIALAAGEPAVSRGFPPSVFADLPRLLERAGPGLDGGGSITGIFSVLVDGDDHNDPVADSIRGTLDGHIVLDRTIAEQGRYPAIDILASISRLALNAWTPDQKTFVSRIKGLIARFEEGRDLRAMGGYVPGGDPEMDRAIALVPALYTALTQDLTSPPALDPFRFVAEALQRAGS